jgi:glycosyltransferase involved in cell wall biosynthesis
MRIGILSSCEGYTWAGSEESWVWVAEAARTAGHEVMLGADWQVARSPRVETLRQRGLRVVERRRRRPLRLYLWKERWLPDMRGMLAFRPDALFLNAGSPLDFCHLPYLAQFCRRFDVPKVLLITFNSDVLAFPHRDAIGSFYDSLDGVICVSEQNRHLLTRQLAGRIPETRLIRNISRLALDAPLPFPSLQNGVRLACVARFDTLWKGHDMLLEVLAAPKWRERPWSLRLYGAGPDDAYVRRLVAFYDLAKRVEFCGWVPEVRTMWQDNHLLVMAARGEGLPLVAVEAMMCGRPAVLTPVGGNAEIIQHGHNGFLADAANELCLDRALEQAWEAQSRWAEMGAAAHVTARQINAIEPGREALRFLEEVISRRAKGHTGRVP